MKETNFLFSTIKKATLFCSCITLLTTVGFSKSYHVAKTGSDTNNGTFETPFKTIQKAASSMTAGDTCYIHAGTYYEIVRPANSGTAGNPLVFTTYQNDDVIVHGGEVITGWTKYKGNIYQVSAPNEVKDLFVNRQYMLLARHPNMLYDPENGFDMCRPTLGTANPPADVDWTGVTVVQNTNKQAWYNKFSKSNSHVLFPDDLVEGGYLMGVPGLIDSEGEWCWKGGILYLWAPGGKDPSTLLIEGKFRDCAFDLTDRNYIVLSKLTVFGASVNMYGSTHCMMDWCKAYYVSSLFDPLTFNTKSDDKYAPMTNTLPGKGILAGGSYNTIQNCEIAHSWGNCVSLLGSHNTVYNCHMYDANWAGWECAVIAMNGGGHVVRQNTLHDAQRSIVTCSNKISMNPPTQPWTIELNEMYNAGLAKTDNGVIYCFLTDGVGSVIAYNWVHDNFNVNNTEVHSGMGIYLDNYSSNFVVHHNVIWNCKTGKSASGIRANNPEPQIYSHGFWPNSHQIYNNTIYNCKASINSPYKDWNGNIGVPYWSETKVFNNILLQSLSFGNAMVAGNYYGNNPMFADTAKHDFRLIAGSPCINGGTAIPGITDGYVGSAPDIGAYEYGGEYWIPGQVLDGVPTGILLFDNLKDSPIKVFPNPASDKLKFQVPEPVESLEVYNMAGVLVLQKQDTGQQEVDIRGLKNGMYLLRIKSGDNIYIEKFIVAKLDK